MSTIILASQSPRRRELLHKMGVTFQVIPSSYEEKLDESRDAHEVAQELALGKALNVAELYPDAYIIGSDTIVAINGRQMGKAADLPEAREMLLALCQGPSIVTTGVAVIHRSRGVQLVEESTVQVFFKPDSPQIDKFREAYLATYDWKDKAGGYGIQSGAAPLIDHIEGDYDAMVGLPTRILARMLDTLGISSHAVIEKSPVPRFPR